MLRYMVALGQCFIRLNAVFWPGEAQWYNFWEAAVAVAGVCAINGKIGFGVFGGDYTRRIFSAALLTDSIVGYSKFLVSVSGLP